MLSLSAPLLFWLVNLYEPTSRCASWRDADLPSTCSPRTGSWCCRATTTDWRGTVPIRLSSMDDAASPDGPARRSAEPTRPGLMPVSAAV